MVSIVNIIGFSIVGADKYKAKKNLWRIPEKTFFLIAVFGGAIGVYAGMLFLGIRPGTGILCLGYLQY